MTGGAGSVSGSSDSAKRKAWMQPAGEQDAAALEESNGTEAALVTERTVEDLAAELEFPVRVVKALAAGEDVVIAALDAGFAPRAAAILPLAFGLK